MARDRVKKYRMICHIIMVLFILSIGINVISGVYIVKSRGQVIEANGVAVEATDINFTEDSLQDYVDKYYSKQLKKLLTEEELMYVAQRQWEYVLSANGKEFKTNTMYMDGAQNIRIMIAEVSKNVDVLPPELLKQGSVWQADDEIELTDYIKIYAPIPYEVTREDQDGSVKYYYEFKDVPAGTIISFQMGELLREKLRYQENIKGNRVEVVVR